MTPILPQNDPNPAVRESWIKRMQSLYVHADELLLPPLPQLEKVPVGEGFDMRYQTKRAIKLLPLVFNSVATRIKRAVGALRLNSLHSYDDYYTGVYKPTSSQIWQYDAEFARQRTAGANPLVIERVRERLPDNFPLSNELFQRVMGTKKTLEGEIQEGKMFIANYALLDGLPKAFYKDAKGQQGTKYFAAPIALFYWKLVGCDERGHLVPVAIQLGQKPDAEHPIFTPLDGLHWLAAKTFVQIADGNYHEAISHLGRTHLVLDPFPVATARQFAENHPVRLLLHPHFHYTIAINALGREALLTPGGYGDQLLATNLATVQKVVTDSVQSWRANEFSLPAELKRRGVDDTELLPHYPYRDDGLLVWDAIRQFVADYLGLYYTSMADIVEDKELFRWLAELKDPNRGNVKGLPESIEHLDQLVDLVTQIIFISGPQHGAVNYPQWDMMGFSPNVPLAAYAPYPTSKDAPLSEADLLEMLPPHQQNATNVFLMYFLTLTRYNRLGFYPKGSFTDPRVLKLVENFKTALASVEAEIHRRNVKRSEPYIFLLPSLIPNSLNI